MEKVNTCALLVENGNEFPQKIKNNTTIQYSNSIAGYIAEKTKPNISLIGKDSHRYVHCCIIYNSQYMAAT